MTAMLNALSRFKPRYDWRKLPQDVAEGVMVALGVLLSLTVTSMVAGAAHWFFARF